jgi:uncharacterized protein YjaG (DUF416 family)
MEHFDEDALRDRLVALPPWKRVAFALLCCERMVPNFERFTATAGIGDGMVLRAGLHLGWHWLATDRILPGLDDLRDACAAQATCAGTGRCALALPALDAANAVEMLLDALERPSDYIAAEVAGLSRDTVDRHVQALRELDPAGAPVDDGDVLSDPLMQDELRRQREDLEALGTWGEDRRLVALRLGERAQRYASGSLGAPGEAKGRGQAQLPQTPMRAMALRS